MLEFFIKKVEDIGGGVLILILLAILFAIGAVVINTAAKVQTSVGNSTAVVEKYAYMNYDDQYVAGDNVIAAIKLAETPNPTKLKITVVTGSGTGAVTNSYGYDNDGDTSYTGYAVTDPSAAAFINPGGTFKSSLVKNNGAVTGIKFTQQ